jgi:hypothetical protein
LYARVTTLRSTVAVVTGGLGTGAQPFVAVDAPEAAYPLPLKIVGVRRGSFRDFDALSSRVGGEFPVARRLVDPKDVGIAIVSVDLEPSLSRRKPTVDDCKYGKPPLPKPEGERLLFTPIAGVTLYANRHAATQPPFLRTYGDDALD